METGIEFPPCRAFCAGVDGLQRRHRGLGFSRAEDTPPLTLPENPRLKGVAATRMPENSIGLSKEYGGSRTEDTYVVRSRAECAPRAAVQDGNHHARGGTTPCNGQGPDAL